MVNKRPVLDARFDLVFLDASKEYDDVRWDWGFYKQYRKDGGIMALHDIDGLRGCEGAEALWHELSRTPTGRMRKYYHEIIAESRSAGIGWYQK